MGEDQELVLKTKSGDISAFEKLVKKYQKRLIGFSYKFVFDHDVCQDVAQDTFLAVYKNIHKIDLNKKFSTFIFEIAKNKCIDYLRHKKKHVLLHEDIPAPEINYDLGIKIEENKYSKVLTLRYLDDLSYDQISKVLKMPINTVRTYIKRGRDELKKIWMK